MGIAAAAVVAAAVVAAAVWLCLSSLTLQKGGNTREGEEKGEREKKPLQQRWGEMGKRRREEEYL